MILFYCVMSAIGGSFLTGLLWLFIDRERTHDTAESGWVTMLATAILALVVLAIAGWLR